MENKYWLQLHDINTDRDLAMGEANSIPRKGDILQIGNTKFIVRSTERGFPGIEPSPELKPYVVWCSRVSADSTITWDDGDLYYQINASRRYE